MTAGHPGGAGSIMVLPMVPPWPRKVVIICSRCAAACLAQKLPMLVVVCCPLHVDAWAT